MTQVNVYPRLLDMQAVGGNFRMLSVDLDEHSPLTILRCLDCRQILESTAGDEPSIREKWTVCERCTQKRNGAKLTTHPQELGIS